MTSEHDAPPRASGLSGFPAVSSRRRGPRRSRRAVAGTTVRWGSLVVALVLAAMMLGRAGQAQDQDSRELAAVQEEIDSSRDQRAGLGYIEDDLREADDGKRWLASAGEASSQVAQHQDDYLRQTGPLSLQDVPKRDPAPEPGTEARIYSTQERYALAAAERAAALEPLKRGLRPYFRTNGNAKGFEPVSRWDKALSTVDDRGGTLSLAEFDWSAPAPLVFARDATVVTAWLLRNEAGKPVGWVSGTYDPVVKAFVDTSAGALAPIGTSEVRR